MTTTPQPAYFTAAATSTAGSMTVEATETGLPTTISIDRAELRRHPDEVAREIMKLTARAANRAKLARRTELAEAGVDAEVMARLGLPTAEEVADAELDEDEDEMEYHPGSWLRGGYE
ncbi:hypothetical protein AB0C34_01965 [Nocardia sp. NPDC049220]|uniref:hypothetical protein n=1 Tax=Nocardia sp. NPDC049220 TaxID=3155273 RepID=UPI0033E70DEE